MRHCQTYVLRQADAHAGHITRHVLNLTTSVSDRIFGQALATGARRAAQQLNLPPYFVQQLLAVEDKRFFYHPGFDFISMLRALLFNFWHSANSPARRQHDHAADLFKLCAARRILPVHNPFQNLPSDVGVQKEPSVF